VIQHIENGKRKKTFVGNLVSHMLRSNRFKTNIISAF